MATLFKAPLHEAHTKQEIFEARSPRDLDRKALRERMFKKFKNTFADLAK